MPVRMLSRRIRCLAPSLLRRCAPRAAPRSAPRAAGAASLSRATSARTREPHRMVVRHRRARRRGGRTWGFQITFFRAATGIAGGEASRFAARQLLFAHAAVTDLAQRRLRHDQRIARSGFGIAEAAVGDTALVLRDWRLKRSDARRREPLRRRARPATPAASPSISRSHATQPVLLQGDGRRVAQGPAARADQPLLQRAAARGARHACASRAARPRSPAAPGSTTNGATPICDPAPSAGTGSASTSTTAAR